ncbi:MAG: tetratricopeptide repeat protein [bacterium]
MSGNLSEYLEKISNFIVKAAIFALPLFFLPWTSEYFEFNKQFFLWLAMPLALFLWLASQAWRGRIKIKINPLNLPIMIFLGLSLASAIFSLDKFSSFFGSYGRFSDAWLGLLSLAIFYFLLVNSGLADSGEKIFALLKLLFYSAGAAAVVSALAIFGAVRWLISDFSDILASQSFNPAGGSLLSLSVFLSVMSVLSVGFLFYGDLKKSDRVVFGAGLILFLTVLSMVNFHLSWAIAASGAGVLIVFKFLEQSLNFKKMLNRHLLIPAAVILAAVFFLSVPEASPAKIILGSKLPEEVLLGHKISFLIAGKAIAENPILGSGPASFARVFSLYRPAEFNTNDYWQIRFDKGSSQFLEMPATLGIPALLSYFLIISVVIYINIILPAKHFKDPDRFPRSRDFGLAAVVFAVFIMLFLSQMFFYANTVLNFCFWLFAALAICFWQERNQFLFKEKIINFDKTALSSKILALFLFFLLFLWIALAAFEIKFFIAELSASSSPNREAGLLKAIRLNPYRANYYISLAKFYLNGARVEAAKPDSAKDMNFIQSNIAKSIEYGRLAAAAAPYSVQTQETSGMIYRDVRNLVLGSEIWAERFFDSAFSLEPANPVLAAELAKAYFNNNDVINAEKYFLKSDEMKHDYYEARFGLAKVYLKNKKDSQAFNLLNELASEIYDEEIIYELGRFYYNHGEIDKAIDRFKLILSSSPKHSNSLYSLGIAYEAKGDIKEALKYYGKVLELNKDNKDVEKKIKDLSK